MLLFNKIYIRPDCRYRADKRSICISKAFRADLVSGMYRHVINGTELEAPLLSAESYDDLIRGERFKGNENAFFEMLTSHPADERLTIYAPVDTIVTILSKFWKALLPRLTVDQYKHLLNCYLSYLLEVTSLNKAVASHVTSTQGAQLREECATALAAEITEDQWKAVKPYSITRTQREVLTKGAGIEFQLPTLITNPTWRHARLVKERIVSLYYADLIQDCVLDVKYTVLNNIEALYKYDDGVDAAGCTIPDLEEICKLYPQYNFMCDTKLTPDNVEYVRQTYSFELFSRLHELIHSTDVYIQPPRLIKDDITFEELVNFVKTTPATQFVSADGDFSDKVNPYMLDFVTESLRRGNTDVLMNYALS